MSLLKTVFHKITGYRMSTTNSEEIRAGYGHGDGHNQTQTQSQCQKRQSQVNMNVNCTSARSHTGKAGVGDMEWETLPHPSKDNFGRPIRNALDYMCKRRVGAVGGCYRIPPPVDEHDEWVDTSLPTWTPLIDERGSFSKDGVDLRVPTVEALRARLPREEHKFIAPNPKKDARAWLWKNETGRQIRKAIRQVKSGNLENGQFGSLDYSYSMKNLCVKGG